MGNIIECNLLMVCYKSIIVIYNFVFFIFVGLMVGVIGFDGVGKFMLLLFIVGE